jgi:hypothetical protein
LFSQSLLGRNPCQKIHHHLVSLDSLWCKVGIAAADIVISKGRIFVNLSRKVAPLKGTKPIPSSSYTGNTSASTSLHHSEYSL